MIEKRKREGTPVRDANGDKGKYRMMQREAREIKGKKGDADRVGR